MLHPLSDPKLNPLTGRSKLANLLRILGVLCLLGTFGVQGCSCSEEPEYTFISGKLDLRKVRDHFVATIQAGKDTQNFENKLNNDSSLYEGNDSIKVLKYDDGSYVGWVDLNNKDSIFNSTMTPQEVDQATESSDPDSPELLFRVRYDTKQDRLIFSDREHRRLQHKPGTQYRDSPNGRWQSDHQRRYYGGHPWNPPSVWVFGYSSPRYKARRGYSRRITSRSGGRGGRYGGGYGSGK